MTKTKIGFLGPKGSFSHEAARILSIDKYLASVGEVFELTPQDSFPRVFNFDSDGQKYWIIVPIDNSTEGLVTQVADLMVENDNFVIIGEYILPIKQNLLMLPEADIKGIQKIYSHPQALGQCVKFLEKIRNNNGDLEEIATKSTSEAAEIVARSGEKYNAAIGSKLSADLNDLKVAVADIADTNNNQTRFFVLERDGADIRNCQPSDDDKTFIIFSVENQPGNLVRVLEVFDVLGINMTMITSRPSKKRLGEYVFFVEFEGHLDMDNVKVVLNRIKLRSKWLKVLGSYPSIFILENEGEEKMGIKNN